MAGLFAKEQPAGFSNRIERIAIVGSSGQLGKYVTAELVKSGKHTITALTRKGNGPTTSSSPVPGGLRHSEVDYDDESSLVAALTGQDLLIIILSVSAPPSTHSALARAAAKAGVGFVIPNSYGFDFTNESLAREAIVGMPNRERCAEIESLGVSSWMAIICGMWYEYSVVMGDVILGLDLEAKKLTLFDSGETKINVSTWDQVARAVAALAALKVLPDDDKDKDTTLSMFRNKPVYVSSFLVSQKDIFASWKRVTGQTDEGWTVEREPVKERYSRGQELLQKGNPQGAPLAMFSRQSFPDGGGNFESTHGLVNKLLGLPTEDLDDRTRAAKELLDQGYPQWVMQRFTKGGGNPQLNDAVKAKRDSSEIP